MIFSCLIGRYIGWGTAGKPEDWEVLIESWENSRGIYIGGFLILSSEEQGAHMILKRDKTPTLPVSLGSFYCYWGAVVGENFKWLPQTLTSDNGFQE